MTSPGTSMAQTETGSSRRLAQLKSLNVAQARALARQRLDAVPELAELRKRHKSLLWPLHEKDLEALIPKEGCPARLLITHCRAGAASHAPVSQDGEEDKAVLCC